MYSWPSYYATEAASTSFQRLYENYNGLADAFAGYWAKLAQEFKNVSGIIGFELMNEPWAGDIYKNPFLMYPGTADKVNLQPFYDRIAANIYAQDKDRMILFESVTWTDEFNVSLDDIGFDHVPGGNEYVSTSVFAFHYYHSPNTGNEDKYFYQRSEDGKRLGTTSFLSETSGNVGDGPHGMQSTLDECDKYFLSWLLWEYKPLAASIGGTCTGCGYGAFYPNGTLNEANVKGYSRTYAQKVAGRTILSQFDWRTDGKYTLVFEMNAKIKEPTIIFCSLEYWYLNGFDVGVEPKNAIVSVVNGNYVELYNSNEEKYDGQQVTVTITNSV